MKKKKNRQAQMMTKAELKKYEALVCPVIERVVKNLGFHLLEVSFVCENQENYLRLTIMHEDHSVSTNDCEVVSKGVGKELDSIDSIPFPYMLEVQSRGINEDFFQEQMHEFVLEKVGLTVRS